MRNLTDLEASEVRLVENLRPAFYAVETIAAHVAKSPAYVRGRISLTELIPAAQTAF